MLSLWACGGIDSAFCDFATLPAQGWAYGDTISLTPRYMSDSIAAGHLVVALRHNNSYPYSNIWLEVTHTAPDGRVMRDTVNCVLADMYGRWKGHGVGASFQFADTIPPQVAVTAGSPITIRHIMRVDTIRNIEHLGIMLVP